MIRAIGNAYATLVPRGRYPAVALFITLRPHDVDVNVHPMKAEVRFRRGGSIFETIYRVLRDRLADQTAATVAAPGAAVEPVILERTGVRGRARRLRLDTGCEQPRRWPRANQAHRRTHRCDWCSKPTSRHRRARSSKTWVWAIDRPAQPVVPPLSAAGNGGEHGAAVPAYSGLRADWPALRRLYRAGK